MIFIGARELCSAASRSLPAIGLTQTKCDAKNHERVPLRSEREYFLSSDRANVFILKLMRKIRPQLVRNEFDARYQDLKWF
jgi:hypothetical protein